MIVKDLTQNAFSELKADFPVYGQHTELDKYRNEHTVRDPVPKCSIHTMWHPMTDQVSVAEYGKDVSKMFYAVIYEDYDIEHNDVIPIKGEDYEVVGIKYFNTYTRLEVKRLTT